MLAALRRVCGTLPLLAARAPLQPHQQQRGLMCLRKRFGRSRKYRWDLMRNLVQALFEHERIKTTQAKAWELRRVADRMITHGKAGTMRARNEARKVVRMDHVLTKLFTSARHIAPHY